MKLITVEYSRGKYPVVITESFNDTLRQQLELYKDHRIYFIADSNVIRLHKKKFNLLLKLKDSDVFVVPSGESSKSLVTLSKIIKDLINNNYNRKTLIIAAGGGVTGDLAGFAASVYMRGVKLMHIPTTIISAADSSIGGKTGINFSGRKNIAGTFYHPEMVLIYPGFLNTLKEKDYISGLGEIVKYAFLSGSAFYNYVNNNFNKLRIRNPQVIEEVLTQCLRFKASVVKEDEKEGSIRKILNLGHTFAHAYEATSGFRIKHGEAVNAGIISALFLSNLKGLITSTHLKELLRLPLKLKLSPLLKKIDENEVYKMMLNDKKNTLSEPQFVLLMEPGRVLIDITAEKKEIQTAAAKMRMLV